jgi:hypothetical protein
MQLDLTSVGMQILCNSIHVAAETAAPGAHAMGHADVSGRINAERRFRYASISGP